MIKKLLIIFTLLMLTIIATAAWAVIEGTPHDVAVMRDLGAGSDIEKCAMCHTPHAGMGQYPLWNRGSTESVTFDLYASPTYDMNDNAISADAYATYNCLVCHNGISSTLANYPGPKSPVNANYNFSSGDLDDPYTMITGSKVGGGFAGGVAGASDHPVSFTYDPTLDDEDNGFKDSEAYGSGQAIFGARGTYPLYSSASDQFECATCHAVHDTVNYSGKLMTDGESSGTQVYFLRGDNSASGMCKDCHAKR